MTGLAISLFVPTPVINGTVPCPPDESGVRWRSHISAILSERARQAGQDELAVLREFIAAVGRPPAQVARIEAGRLAPTAEYRGRAAAVLGVEAFEVVDGTA